VICRVTIGLLKERCDHLSTAPLPRQVRRWLLTEELVQQDVERHHADEVPRRLERVRRSERAGRDAISDIPAKKNVQGLDTPPEKRSASA